MQKVNRIILFFIFLLSSFTLNAKTIPHEIWGITLGSTPETEARKIVESKGFGYFTKQGDASVFIGSTVRNCVEFNMLTLSFVNGIVDQIGFGNLYSSSEELARSLLVCGPKIQEAYKQYEVPTYDTRSMRFVDGKYFVSINTSYDGNYHYLLITYGKTM